MLHPTLFRELETENMEVTQRPRSSTENISRLSESDSGFAGIQPEALVPDTSLETETNEVDESSEERDEKCSAPFFRVLPKFLRKFDPWCVSRNKVKNKQDGQEEDWEVPEDEEYDDDDDDNDDDEERDDLRVASSITFIFSQCIGWIMCCIFVG